MTRAIRLLPTLLSMTLLGGWMASCSDESSPECGIGDTRLCACVGRDEGAQACLPDRSGYGPCDCSDPPRNGMGGASMDDGTRPLVGRQCTEDAQCGAGLSCFEAASNEFFGGGPAGGYCTVQCASTAECTAIDPLTQCEAGLCLRTCRSMDPTSVAENKCLSRHDVVCQSAAYLSIEEFTGLRQPGLCLPQCGSDQDCGGGRFCDLARGVCASTRPSGAAVGERCEVDGDCLGGRCLTDGPDERFCTSPCVFGQPVGCGEGAAVSPRNVACLAPVIRGFVSSEGIGDVGFCLEVCDVDADCAQAATRDWVCLPDAEAERFGRSGLCRAPQPTDAGADGGDEGDAGGDPPVVEAGTDSGVVTLPDASDASAN